jgi:drug/metabolite transporter (DMT)-like permease
MMIVVLSIIFLREMFSWLRGAGILISLTGVIWIISHGSWQAFIALTFNRGDLWMLLAVLCWAIYSIGVRKTAGKFPANEMLLITVIVSVIVLLPFTIFELTLTHRPIHVTWATISGVFYIGLFASLVAFSFWNKAVALIGPSRCANFLNLIPLFSAIFATIFTGEHIRLFHGVGGCLILGGVYLTTRSLNVRQAMKNEI